MRQGGALTREEWRVSILARPEGRALRVRGPGGSFIAALFQSSPGPKAERCVPWPNTGTLINLFQSSPGPKAERCLWTPTRTTTRSISFQSSPGPKAERCRISAAAVG